MAQPPPALHEIARIVLGYEAAGANAPDALAAALSRVLGKLQDDLNNLVGRRGVAALVGRALHLAKRDFANLDSVTFEAESPEVLIGLGRALHGQRATEGEAACEAVVVQLLELLTGLLGDDLGLRPIHRIWPDVTSARRDGHDTRKTEQ